MNTKLKKMRTKKMNKKTRIRKIRKKKIVKTRKTKKARKRTEQINPRQGKPKRKSLAFALCCEE